MDVVIQHNSCKTSYGENRKENGLQLPYLIATADGNMLEFGEFGGYVRIGTSSVSKF